MPRLLLAILAAATFLLAAGPADAHAATPCWKRVIQDWTADGTINGRYSPHCLRQAIKNTPEDLRDYSPIDDDINAALLDTLATKNATNNGGNGPGGAQPNSAAAKKQQERAAKEAKRRANKAVPNAGTAGSIPSSSSSVPLPLIIMGAIALAALLAALSPPLIHRVRGRFPRGRPAPQAER
jgi:hypothetical protein